MSRHKTIPLSQFQKSLLSANRPFVSYRLPGDRIPVTIAGKGFKMFSSMHDMLMQKNGFVIAPFEEEGQMLWLDSEISVRGFEVQVSNDRPHSEQMPEFPFPEGRPVSREEYIGNLRDALQHIKKGEAGKIVLTRWLMHEWSGAAGYAGDLFSVLCESHPGAFVYLAHIPGQGLWAGASPELLLESAKGVIRTVSLSGTRVRRSAGAAWGNKEMEEHMWVSRYIAEQLELLGCENILVSPVHTVEAGVVEHLRTAFSAGCGLAKLPSLLYALHPTPAVCGWPTAKAYDIIRKIERYKRSFYTGFLGPVGQNGEFRLFVNLRCMNILKDHCLIYAGGGITIDSDPESEWNETELKSQTMLGAIEKIANFAQ